MVCYNLLNIANYKIIDLERVSLEIQMKILIENEHNIDILCIQVKNNKIYKKIVYLLKYVFNNKNYFDISPSFKYVSCDYLNLITLSKYKILNYKYYYKKNKLNYLLTNIYFNNNIISIINTDIDSYDSYNNIINTIYFDKFKINSKHKFISGINIKNNLEFSKFLNNEKLLNIFFEIYKKNLLKINIFYLNKIKNKITFLKCNNIKDILLSDNLIKMICIIK